jgi:hypothetical protein
MKRRAFIGLLGGAISGGSGYITRRHHRERPRVEVVVEALGRARSP